jgi:3-hydroxybutyryl-CoA dehydrogenase
MRFDPVGVVGAGVMGVGVAQALAQSGHRVLLVDVADAALERARRELRQNLRMQSLLAKKKEGGESAAAVLARVEFTRDEACLAAAAFVVENVVEKWAVKEPVYRRLGQVLAPECVIAANTSCVSITRLGSVTPRPERVIGMHFMNPVPLMPTAEVVRGHHTSDATVETARAFLAEMGKDAIVVNDLPGFVSNRVLMLTVNEAVWVVQDGVAPAADVDRLFKSCFGHKMGPLETGDLIGLDTILYSLEVLYESYNDPKFRPAPLLRKMVDAGLHGRKTGRGFYDYGDAAL